MSNKYKSRKNAKAESEAYVANVVDAMQTLTVVAGDTKVRLSDINNGLDVADATRKASNEATENLAATTTLFIEGICGIKIEHIIKSKDNALFADIKRATCQAVSGYESERKANKAGNPNAWRRVSKCIDRLEWKSAPTEAVANHITVARQALSANVRLSVAKVCADHKVTASDLVDWLTTEATNEALEPDIDSRIEADIVAATASGDEKAIKSANKAAAARNADLDSVAALYAKANESIDSIRKSAEKAA